MTVWQRFAWEVKYVRAQFESLVSFFFLYFSFWSSEPLKSLTLSNLLLIFPLPKGFVWFFSSSLYSTCGDTLAVSYESICSAMLKPEEPNVTGSISVLTLSLHEFLWKWVFPRKCRVTCPSLRNEASRPVKDKLIKNNGLDTPSKIILSPYHKST